MILAVLLMGQSVDAASCPSPSDQGALMQLRASGMINDTTTDGTRDALAQSVYSSVQVDGGPFAVATPTPNNPAVEAVSQCGRAEGSANGGASTAFCLCQAFSFGSVRRQVFQKTDGGGDADVEFVRDTTDTSLPGVDWSIITPAEPTSSALRCFRAEPVNDPEIVMPSGFNFSCQDPTPNKTSRDPHRSCTFNHVSAFPPQHLQQVPPNTQVVGLCVQRVDNPNENFQVRNYNSTCEMVEPAQCSSNVSTFQLPNYTTRTFSFLLKCCDPNANDDVVGQADGDPHIHSLRGAHYTLLSQGNFVAWSYSKGTGETEAELFASYAGSRFTTQALALKIKGSKAEMLEITAQDCQWRAKSSGQWVEAESKDFSESNLEVEPPIKGQGRLYMHTSMLLNKLAKVMTRCKPGAHLDFKVEMLHKQDLQYVGGQLGAAPDEQKTRILSSGLTRLKTDSKFQVGEWLSLGGSAEAALFLKAKTVDHPPGSLSLLSTSPTCTESEKDMAHGICEKHFGSKKTLDAELFSDCIYDVCSGGGDEAAASIADLLSA